MIPNTYVTGLEARLPAEDAMGEVEVSLCCSRGIQRPGRFATDSGDGETVRTGRDDSPGADEVVPLVDLDQGRVAAARERRGVDETCQSKRGSGRQFATCPSGAKRAYLRAGYRGDQR